MSGANASPIGRSHQRMSVTRVWLIRHGEPEQSVHGKCYGALDVGLSEAGVAQMQYVAQTLASVALDAIWVSPKRRAAESARLISQAHRCPVEVADGLSEIDFGQFEGRSYDEIAAEYPDIYRQWMECPTEVRFPGGETFAEMWARVTACAESIRNKHRGGSIALVTHGGVIRILLAEALSIAPANIFRIGQQYGALSLITYFDDTPVVEFGKTPV